MTKEKMYVFTLMRNDRPSALWEGSKELPYEVINHEFSHSQMTAKLLEFGYKLMKQS